jgi:hypothetical protein
MRLFIPKKLSTLQTNSKFIERGSWLNIAECELSVLSRQCLKRRIGDSQRLNVEVQAWAKSRNRENIKCDWQFTIEDARIKLKSLYPKLVKNI